MTTVSDVLQPLAPVWVLCWLLGGIGAVLADVIRPRGLVGLVHLVIVGAFGAVAGQVVAEFTGFSHLVIGELHVVEAAVGALVTILVARRMGA